VSLDIETVKKAIDIPEFTRTDLLEIALTHPSKIYQNGNLTQQQKALQEREYRRLAILLALSILTIQRLNYLFSLGVGEKYYCYKG
jgi:dsRNA-specific ribonuclease